LLAAKKLPAKANITNKTFFIFVFLISTGVIFLLRQLHCFYTCKATATLFF